MQRDRHCRNCGQALQTEDRFCANCGRPVHATATVPTPEADVSVPPLPQQAVASQQLPRAVEQTAAPTPEPQEHPQWRWKWDRGPIIPIGCIMAPLGQALWTGDMRISL